MPNWIRRLLAPPIFEDEEQTRLARLLTTILQGIFVAVIVVVPFTAALAPADQVTLRLGIGTAVIALVTGLIILTRRGWLRLSSVLLPSALLAIITMAISNFGGLRSAVTASYLVVIVVAGLLLGGRGAIVFSVLSGLATLGVLVAEATGWIAPLPASTSLCVWVIYAVLFSLMALLLSLAAQSIRDGLENARRLHAVEQERARELAALLAAERKRAQQLKLLARVAHQLVGFDDPQALMDEAVRRLHEDFGFEHIALLIAEGGELVMRAQHGAFVHLAPPLQRVPLGRGIVGWAAETGLTYLANDVAADGHFHPLPDANTASELAVPLRLGPDVIGVLNVESEQIGAFDTTDVSMLESLADLLAAGLQSSRLSAELRARERMAEALQRVSAATTASLDLPTVLDTVCAEACAAFAADGVAVWLLAEDAETLEAVAAYGLSAETVLGQRRPLTDPASITARAVRERRPIFVNDLPHASEGETQLKSATGAQALLVTPILKDMQPLGAITILDAYHPQRFRAEDVAAAELLGAQLAVAIHNARLFEAERRRAAQLSLLEEVSRQIAGTLDEGEIFQRAVTGIVNRFGFAQAGIVVPVGDGELELIAVAGSLDIGPQPGFRQKIGQGIIGQVAASRAAYVTGDISHDPYYFNPVGGRAGSALGVPLQREDQLLGVVYVESIARNTFDADDVRTLETLANHIATALQNARLYTRARDRLREMTALQSGAQTVASSLELHQIFQTVVQLLQDTFGYPYVSLYQLDGEVLRLGAQVGYPAALIISEVPITIGVSGRTVRTQQTQFIRDVRAEPDFLRASYEVQSEICVPLLKDQTVLGILNVESGPEQPLAEADVDILTVFASQVTVAIENARLFEAERAQHELAEALRATGAVLSASLDFETVLDRLLDQIARVVRYDTANIMLVDSEGGRTRMARTRGYEQFGAEVAEDTANLTFEIAVTPNLRRMAETGQPLIIPDTAADPGWVRVKAAAHIRSWAGAPILAQGHVIAFFSVGKMEPNVYRPADAERLAAFSGQAALALQNAQLFEQTRRRAAQLSALNEIGRAVSALLDMDSLLEVIYEQARRSLPLDFFFVCLYEAQTNLISYPLVYDGGHRYQEASSPLIDDSYSGRAIRTGQPLLVNYSAEEMAGEAGRRHRMGDTSRPSASLLFAPLRVGPRVIGVISAQSYHVGAYADEHQALLTGMAQQIAVAIENARLFAMTGETLAREQRLNEMARTISSTLNIPTVLPTVVRLAAELVGAEAGALGLVAPDGQTITYPYLFNLPEQVRLTPAPKGQGLAWHIVETGQSVLQDDYRAHPNALPNWVEAGVCGFIGVPVTAGEVRLGALGLFSLNPDKRFTERDLNLAESAGRQAGVAIQNARLFEAEQRRAEEQRLLFQAAQDFTAGLSEQAVLSAIARHMIGTLKVARCAVSLWEPGPDRVITLLNYDTADAAETDPLGTAYALADYPATRRVLESRRPIVVRADDPGAAPAETALLEQLGYAVTLKLPLVVGERAVGLVELSRRVGAPYFSEADLQLAQGLAAPAAVALENARLHTTVTERARELDALLTANAAMLSTLDLDPLLDNILQAALAAIPAAEKGTILLQDPATGQLQIRAISGYTDARVQNFNFAGSEGYSAKAAREQRALLIPDVRADPAIRYNGDIPEVSAISSAIAVPLILHDQPLGVISLDATRRAAFTEADLRLLVAFANAAAVAIDNARLHAEVRALAVTDGLTGLANHRAFDQALEAEVARAGRYGYPLALVFLDIDSFKLYNETYGHPAGNERLKAIAALLHDRVREPDLAARYGGEEFALILPHTHKDGALVLAERIRVAAEAAAPNGGASGVPVSGYTLSLGVAVFPGDALTPDDLLVAADNAEIAAKRAGKDRVVAAPALTAR